MTSRILESIFSQIGSTDSAWSTDNVFIIGKGPSIDELEGFELPPGLVININDSEKIIQGHIGVFSANWVRHSLKDRGFKCRYYLAGKPLPAQVPHDLTLPIPLEIDSEELILYRFGMEEYYDEGFILLNALKICRQLSIHLKKKLDVYLLGFDFSTAKGEVSKNLGVDYAKEAEPDRELVVHSQEYDYLQMVKFFQDNPVLNLWHVGNKEYSKLTTTQFREKFSIKVQILSKTEIEPRRLPENSVLIVAELTNNHLGDTQRLIEMVERAKDAGADLIKIQKRDVDTFYSAEKLNSYYWSPFGKTLGDYRKGVELDEEKLTILDKTCRSLKIDWFCSVLDYPSFEVIRRFNPKLIKIPSTISNHRDFHQQIANVYKGPIVISTGYTDQSYEDYVLKTFASNEKIYLLHCISAYPTPLHDCNVSVVRHYAELAKKYPTLIPGYSSHDIGSFGSMLAVASGAKMIEKHVKLGDVSWVHFDKVALDLKTDTFKKFVTDIRNTELALGSPVKRVLPSEHHKYEVVIRKG
ncbi:MAG: N-acetylneuraminate synthase family protein [Cyclobacteriaceae bacterium]|nr:N-acetylneuraminate synthase family protein [Cyclobacteriaceae bacterium]